MTIKTNPLEGLNPQQEEAVKHFTGPLLIVAGAGTGKTRVITHRIAYLIDGLGVVPTQILALTFTNKAADEMRERTVALVGERAKGVMLSTFHSFCNYILRRNIEKLECGYDSSYSIYDETDARNCIKAILKAMELPTTSEFAPGRIANILSRSKNFCVKPAQYVGMHENLGDYIQEIAEQYEKRLVQNNALDFDDLLLKTLKLFKTNEGVLERYRSRFKFVLVDEYQDTNHVQYEILMGLVPADGNITVVGDLDQSIYGWRGADAGNVLSFERDFDDVTVVTLERNYRSKQNILNAANSLIRFNPGVREKRLWSDLGDGNPLKLHLAWDEREEALFVAREVDYLFSEGYRPDDIAVLFRSRAQTRVFEEIFITAGLRYILVNATAFYDRKEIKDIIAYLRVVENPKDLVSFGRIANSPRRGIGEKSLLKIEEVAFQYGSLFSIPEEEKKLPKGFPPKALPLIKALKKLHESRQEMSITDLIKNTSVETGYYKYLESLEKTEGLDRTENLDEFINIAAEYENSTSQPTLEGFLSHVSLKSDVDVDVEGDGVVRLMTLHSAKGLEFPVVFIAGIEENILPHRTSIEESGGDTEERRLCYVGITRSREQLYMTACRSRLRFGHIEHNNVSRFVDEIGSEHFEVLSCPSGRAGNGESFFDGSDESNDSEIAPRRRKGYESDEDNVGETTRFGRFRPGNKIEHEELGVGTVMKVKGEDIAVSFPGRGVWWLSLDSAPIRKI